MDLPLAEIAAMTGRSLRSLGRLAGGEQTGAQLVTDGRRRLVLKLQPDPQRAARLLRAVPALEYAVAQGWPAAAWLHAGQLADGTAYLITEHVDGEPLEVSAPVALDAVVQANSFQAGLGLASAFDDSAQLLAVAAGDHPWYAAVRDHSAPGLAVLRRAGELLGRLGPVRLPVADVIHGDYSSSNMIMASDGTVRFIDCETVGRGTRVRDLADLHRQCFVHPGAPLPVVRALRDRACAIEGPEVFIVCSIAVTYNNLAWWAEYRPSSEFRVACERIELLLDDLTELASGSSA